MHCVKVAGQLSFHEISNILKITSKCLCQLFSTFLQVREQVMQRYRIATHQKTYADMIREDAVPDIGYVLYFHLLPVTLSVVSA